MSGLSFFCFSAACMVGHLFGPKATLEGRLFVAEKSVQAWSPEAQIDAEYHKLATQSHSPIAF